MYKREYMSENNTVENVEKKCKSFVERCFLAHTCKKDTAKSEARILSMLEEVVGKVEKGFTKEALQNSGVEKNTVQNPLQKTEHTIELAQNTVNEPLEETQKASSSVVDTAKDANTSQDNTGVHIVEEKEEIILPLATEDEKNAFLPKHTIYDAIPINKENISILCTPVEYTRSWKVETKVEKVLGELIHTLCSMQEELSTIHSASEWVLEDVGTENFPTQIERRPEHNNKKKVQNTIEMLRKQWQSQRKSLQENKTT